MKKKTALTLSAIALLSAGITFGIKFKQKKDFEKTLKTVLIPNAEKELDSLLREDAALKDSVITYEQALAKIKAKDQQTPVTNDSLMKKELKTLENLLISTKKDIDKEWKETEKSVEKYRMYEDGNTWYEDVPSSEIKKFKKFWQLSSGILLKLQNTELYYPVHARTKNVSISNDDWEYSDEKQQFDFSGIISEKEFYTICGNGHFSIHNNTSSILEDIILVLRSTKGAFVEEDYSRINVYVTEYEALNAYPDILLLLNSLKTFSDNIDNSQGFIKQQTLDQIKTTIGQLLPYVQSQTKEEYASKKVNKFKTAQKGIKTQIKKQNRKIKHLKTTDIAKLMKEQNEK